MFRFPPWTLALFFPVACCALDCGLSCDIPQPPTIVVSIPGRLDGDAVEASPIEIFNATGAKAIAFTIVGRNVFPLNFALISISVPPGASYTLEESPRGDSAQLAVRTTGAGFEVGYLTLDLTWAGCGNDCSTTSIPINTSALMAFDGEGVALPVRAISGGYSTWQDAGALVMYGSIFYSDALLSG